MRDVEVASGKLKLAFTICPLARFMSQVCLFSARQTDLNCQNVQGTYHPFHFPPIPCIFGDATILG
jgi:hypothetical protein